MSTYGRISHLTLYAYLLDRLQIPFVLISCLNVILQHAHVAPFPMQDEISGWAEDLFTARKSAINLLGVIAMSKVIIPNKINFLLIHSRLLYFFLLFLPINGSCLSELSKEQDD